MFVWRPLTCFYFPSTTKPQGTSTRVFPNCKGSYLIEKKEGIKFRVTLEGGIVTSGTFVVTSLKHLVSQFYGDDGSEVESDPADSLLVSQHLLPLNVAAECQAVRRKAEREKGYMVKLAYFFNCFLLSTFKLKISSVSSIHLLVFRFLCLVTPSLLSH